MAPMCVSATNGNTFVARVTPKTCHGADQMYSSLFGTAYRARPATVCATATLRTGKRRHAMDWNEEFESGLADIDVQHRYIFALIQRVNHLDDKIQSESLREIAQELARLANCHFGCEGQLMSAYEYPESDRHQLEHQKLLDVVYEFQRTGEYHARHLALFLCNWLVSHTMLEDRRLARHVLQQRAKVMGMTVEDFVVSMKMQRPSAVFAKASPVPQNKVVGE